MRGDNRVTVKLRNQNEIINLLRRNKEGLRYTDLEESVSCSKHALIRNLRILMRDGLIYKKLSDDWKRVLYVLSDTT
jgi:DNA-binding HxlR family transcriptional regulator